MSRSRTLVSVLAFAALGTVAAAALPTDAGALPLAPPAPTAVLYQSSEADRPAMIQHRARVSARGIYRIRVEVKARRYGDRLVRIRVGHLARQVLLAGARQSATVVVVEALSHHWLLVRATSRREAPLLSVQVSRVNPATTVTAPAAAKPTTRASGPTGPTGATAAAGASAPATTPTPAPAPSAPTPPAQPRDPSQGPWGDPGTWNLVFDDEFNESTLDTNLWNTGWLSSGVTGPMNSEELECYSPSQDVVSNGELDLNLAATPQTGCLEAGGPQTVNEPYVSGMINTRDKFSYTYGFLEARVWLPGSPWAGVDWPAVWEVGDPAPQNGEIDLIEGLGGEGCWHFHDPTGAAFGGCLGGWDGTWHTFGVDWEPGNITWYFDGGPVGTVTANVTGDPMYLIANLALDSQWGGPVSAPASLRIDYIRVWQH